MTVEWQAPADAFREAIDDVRKCADAPPEEAKAIFHGAMSRLVRARNAMLAETRDSQAPRTLHDLNALLSLMYSIEFPLMGLHRDRLAQVTRALQRIQQNSP